MTPDECCAVICSNWQQFFYNILPLARGNVRAWKGKDQSQPGRLRYFLNRTPCHSIHRSSNPYKNFRNTILKLLVFSERFFRKAISKSLACSIFKVPPIPVFFPTDLTDPTDPTDLLDPSDPPDPTDQSEKPIDQITNSRAISSAKATTLKKISCLFVSFRC